MNVSVGLLHVRVPVEVVEVGGTVLVLLLVDVEDFVVLVGGGGGGTTVDVDVGGTVLVLLVVGGGVGTHFTLPVAGSVRENLRLDPTHFTPNESPLWSVMVALLSDATPTLAPVTMIAPANASTAYAGRIRNRRGLLPVCFPIAYPSSAHTVECELWTMARRGA